MRSKQISGFFTATTILEQCVTLLHQLASSHHKVKQIHAFSIRHGVSLTNLNLNKHLIYSLVSLSAPMSYVHNIFSQIQHPNTYAFNTLIRGYAEAEIPAPALDLYRKMQLCRIKPDTHTYPFVLKAVAKLGNVRVGEIVHSVAVKDGFEPLIFVRNCLVYMYSVCGCAEDAYKVFVIMPERDIVAWNSVINGFALNGKPNEALCLFREMSLEGVEPDGFTMVSFFSACVELGGALELGRRAHVYIIKAGLNENLKVNNAILDFYAKCGKIWEAKKMFEDMKERNVVSWSSLIVGLGVNGFGVEAIRLFEEMESAGMVPTVVTFVGLLYACSHCGMVDRGFEYFAKMKDRYGIEPKIEHYGCMVDLLGRAGQVREAYEYIKAMPVPPNAVIWRTLLGACTVHGHSTIGEIAKAELLRLEPNYDGDFVLLSNLYASEHRWLDVQKVRRTMVQENVKKMPGQSIVELGNDVHEFYMGDRSHPQKEEIYAMLAEINKKLKLEGYVPQTENVFADIEEEEKENALSYHSEKIAIAFMLINTPPGTPIRVVKNLRVCADCHLAIKLISKVFSREIIIRDRSRFHHFKDGDCCCKDYW